MKTKIKDTISVPSLSVMNVKTREHLLLHYVVGNLHHKNIMYRLFSATLLKDPAALYNKSDIKIKSIE